MNNEPNPKAQMPAGKALKAARVVEAGGGLAELMRDVATWARSLARTSRDGVTPFACAIASIRLTGNRSCYLFFRFRKTGWP